MMWYQALRWALIGIGLFSAGYFCLTWTPRAMRVRGIGGWQMLDTAGWVWAGFLLLCLSTYSGLTHDWVEPRELSEAIYRISVLAFIDFIIVVRATRWLVLQHQVQQANRAAKRESPTST